MRTRGLIVDDDLQTSRRLQESLTDMDIDLADSLAKGIEKTKNAAENGHPYNVIITEALVSLGNLNPLSIDVRRDKNLFAPSYLNKFCQEHLNLRTPLICFTTQENDIFVKQAMDALVEDYILKNSEGNIAEATSRIRGVVTGVPKISRGRGHLIMTPTGGSKTSMAQLLINTIREEAHELPYVQNYDIDILKKLSRRAPRPGENVRAVDTLSFKHLLVTPALEEAALRHHLVIWHMPQGRSLYPNMLCITEEVAQMVRKDLRNTPHSEDIRSLEELVKQKKDVLMTCAHAEAAKKIINAAEVHNIALQTYFVEDYTQIDHTGRIAGRYHIGPSTIDLLHKTLKGIRGGSRVRETREYFIREIAKKQPVDEYQLVRNGQLSEGAIRLRDCMSMFLDFFFLAHATSVKDKSKVKYIHAKNAYNGKNEILNTMIDYRLSDQGAQRRTA
jgi:hypothetical protein